MSLINDALKKAQAERPSSVTQNPSMQNMPMEPHPRPPRQRNYLLSFIIAVLVIALLSTLVSTYLVFQLLGENEPEVAEQVQSQEGIDSSAGQQALPETAMRLDTEAETAGAAEAVDQVEPDPVSPATEPIEQVQSESAAPQSMDEPEVTGVPATEPEVVAETPEQTSPEDAAVGQAQLEQPAPQNPVRQPVAREPAPRMASHDSNPLVWSRLDEFEIRGIMSGGSKVLIFDSRTGKARAYTPGDLIDGALSLKVFSISNAEITFQSNDESIFSKPF